MSVTKSDGSRQLFDRDKIARTCMRMGASNQLALQVAEKVESRVYEGMPTKEILRLIFRFMRKEKPSLKHLFDLRRGLSLMTAKPEFELFVQTLLAHNGFDVSPNCILKGRCVEHEVDAIARKEGVTYFVEAKHHFSYHALTGLDESRIARAVLEDVSEGFQMGIGDFRVDKAMIVTNTRYSEHAIRYGKCRDLKQIGWKYPENEGLEIMIEKRKLIPISCLREIRPEDRLRLAANGIILIRQLMEEDSDALLKKTGLKKREVEYVLEKARYSASALSYY